MATVTQTAPVEVNVNSRGYNITQTRHSFYPRTTTFLNMLPKPWLGAWAARTVAEFAVEYRDTWVGLPKTDAIKLLKGSPWTKRDDAGDRGSAVHKAIESYLTGKPLPDGLNEEEYECAIAAENFLKDAEVEVLAVELTVFSDRWRVAGTLDISCLIGGVLYIVDWKTAGKGVYPEAGIQLAFYQQAEYAVLNGEIVPWGPAQAGHAAVVHIAPEKYPRGYSFHPVRTDFTVFRAAKHIKEWTGRNKNVIGAPVTFSQNGGKT